MAKGWTLIELLVTTAIAALVIFVVGASLTAGLRVWATAESFNRIDSTSALATDIMKKDLANALPFFAIPFQGKTREVVFASLLEDPQASSAGVPRLGSVKYTLDASRAALMRRKWAFPSPEPAGLDQLQEIATGVTDLSFEYFQAPIGPESGGAWGSTWESPTNLPGMIRVRLSFQESTVPVVVQRDMVLPVGCQPPPEENREVKP
jgi:type II secretory pathway component PulJ